MPDHVPDQAEGLRRLIDSAATVPASEAPDTDLGEEAIKKIDEAAEVLLAKDVAQEDGDGEKNELLEEPTPLQVPGSVFQQEPSVVIPITPSSGRARPSPRGRDSLGIRSATRVVAITSGKGGVGKTNLVCNLALALSQMGKRVVVFDADLSLANIDVLLGLSPRYNLSHVFSGEKTLKEILVTGPERIRIVPGGSGIEEMANLNGPELERLLDSFEELDGECDVVLIDTAAGISQMVLSFLLAADYVVVVTTPEPTAYTDAYALIKVLTQYAPDKSLAVAVNMARDSRESADVVRLMLQICRTMLHVGFDNLGSIPRDVEVLQAVRDQRPLLLHSPYSPAAKSIRRLASTLLQSERRMTSWGGLRGFMTRLLGRVGGPHLFGRIVVNKKVC